MNYRPTNNLRDYDALILFAIIFSNIGVLFVFKHMMKNIPTEVNVIAYNTLGVDELNRVNFFLSPFFHQTTRRLILHYLLPFWVVWRHLHLVKILRKIAHKLSFYSSKYLFNLHTYLMGMYTDYNSNYLIVN